MISILQIERDCNSYIEGNKEVIQFWISPEIPDVQVKCDKNRHILRSVDRSKQDFQNSEFQSYPYNLTPSGNYLLELTLLYLLFYMKTSLMLTVFLFLQNEPAKRVIT